MKHRTHPLHPLPNRKKRGIKSSLCVGLLFLFGMMSSLTTAGNQVIRLDRLREVKDATPVVREVLEQLKGPGKHTLELPTGTFHFYPDKAFGKYHCITNHDNGFKVFAFPIIGFKDLTIKGNNTELIFHGRIIPFLIEASSNIRIEGVSIDWEVPFFAQGRIIASNAAEKHVDVLFDGFSPLKYENNSLIIRGEDWQQPFLGDHIYWDSVSPRIAYKTTKYHIPSRLRRQIRAEHLPHSAYGHDSAYRIHAPFPNVPPKGLRVTYKGMTGENRLCPAFHLIGAKDVVLERVNVYHAGGMGLIAEKSENISLNTFHVRLRPGTQRLVSTTADATHFCNCKGEIRVEHCIFENMLDDALNIHGTYTKVTDRIDSVTLGASLVNFQQFGYVFAQVGDRVLIVQPESLLPAFEAKVRSVKAINEKYIVLTFDRPLPPEIQNGYGLDNLTWSASLVFRNNVVRNNRARSLLLSSSQKMLVENNTFSSQMSAILVEGDLDYWYESGSVSHLTIRNNLFLDCMYGGDKGAVIWINPHVKRIKNRYYEKNIRIENNLFRHFDRNIFLGYNIDGLVLRNNRIEPSNTFDPLCSDDHPNYVFDHVINVSNSDSVNTVNLLLNTAL